MARKEKKYHFIYKTINIVNNKFYIGMHSTDNLKDGYMGSGTRLWYSINKYGKENHNLLILEYYPTRSLLKEREKELINDKLLKDPMCMNCKYGGEGGLDGLCDESIKRIRLGASKFIFKMRENPEYIKKINKLSSERMKEHHKNGKIKYDTFTNKKHTNETKHNMSISHKGMGSGENNSQFNTCWITKNGINKKIKKENLQNYISEGWLKGRII